MPPKLQYYPLAQARQRATIIVAMEFLDQQINPPASWEKFEELCRALFAEIWNDALASRHGRTGQKQHGVDIHGVRPDEPGNILGVQCKGKDSNFAKKATIAEFNGELCKAEKFTPALSHWTFVTSHADDALLQAHARAVSVDRVAVGKFPVAALGWGNLQSLLAEHTEVIEQFYPEIGSQLPELVKRLSALPDQIREALKSRADDAGLYAPPTTPLNDRRKARAIIKKTGGRIVDRLSFLGLYKSDRTIDRDGFNVEWHRFVTGGKMVWPIIGMSGVGKTSVLAHLLSKQCSTGPAILLMQARDIRAHHHSLVDLLVGLPWPSDLGAPTAVIEQLQRLGTLNSTILLLDGLNEADHAFLRASWIPNSLDWLRTTGARLALTCRPESWIALESAFPSGLVHRLPVQPPAAPSKPPKTPDFFRLSDFTEGEAASAATAYGFEAGRAAIAHPFLLAIAAELEADTNLHSFNHLAALDAFVSRRIMLSLDRLGEPSWFPDIERCLGEVADLMYRRREQVLTANEWTRIFDRFSGTIDRLADEHLILKSEAGYRFQFDQVRELLQSRSLSPEDVLRELLPLPKLSRDTPYSTGLAALLNLLLAFDWRRKRRGHEKGSSPRVNAALAAVVVTRSALARDPALPNLLEALYEATASNRLDVYAEWASLVVQAVLQYAPAELLDEPIFVDWLRCQLDRYDINWYREWPEMIVRSTVAYLVRSPGPIAVKHSLLQAVILREHDGRWGSNNIENRAWIDRYLATTPAPDRAFSGLLSETATGQLVESLIAQAPVETIRLLASFLPLESLGYRERGREQAKISSVAAKCLFSFKHRDPALVVSLAIESHGRATQDLVDGLAVTDSDCVARYCLDKLTAAETGYRSIACFRALWHAAHHIVSYETNVAVAKFAVNGLLEFRGEELHWAVRIFCELNLSTHRNWAKRPDEHAETLAIYRPLAARAAILLRTHIQANEPKYVQGCDYNYLLELDFEEGLARLDLELGSSAGISPVGFSGLRKYVGPGLLSEPGRIEKHHQIVALLHRYLDQHGEKAGAHIAAFVLRSADRCDAVGHFSGQQVIDLGILDLACRIIALGGDGTFNECGNFRPPLDDTIRRRLLEAFRDSEIGGSDLESVVRHCWSEKGLPHSESFDTQLIFALRTEGREQSWDDGARRYLYLHHKDSTLSEEIVAFWRGLPATRMTTISRAIVERVKEGWVIREAANRPLSDKERGRFRLSD